MNAVTRALSREGHDVSGTGSGVDALSEVATRPPDAVVLDLGLPDIGGVEVVRRLRGWNDVPVLILSAAGGEARKVEALDAGADDYLEKPFGLDELRARLRALLRRSTPVRADAAPIRVDELAINLPRRTITRDGAEVRLTPKVGSCWRPSPPTRASCSRTGS